MTLLGSFRSDQLIQDLVGESDPAGAKARKLVDKIKNSGPKVIPKVIDALAMSDKTHTMVFVDILSALVSDKTLEHFRAGLADGNERVVKGTAWALSSSTDYNVNQLLDWFEDDEVSNDHNPKWSGYILAPLGVKPEYQKHRVGSELIESGIKQLSENGVNVLFVYGDPKYYGKFGFNADTASGYTPPYKLQYPFGWQAITLNEAGFANSNAKISCVASLCDPELW